jgi:indole-3-glycerol phosphate synthase
MNTLDKILLHKKKEVEERKTLHPVELLEKSAMFSAKTVSLKDSLQGKNKSGIIAEIKRKSPSRGIINASISVEQLSKGYIKAGACAISVLTDSFFFGGSNDDLITAREFNACPILRKDFIIDQYQIIEAKSIGADAILLIASALKPQKLKELCVFAHSLKLEVLMEVHDGDEVKANLGADADLIGVNNRNLRTFEVNIEVSKQLSSLIPDSIIKVSESGIESPNAIVELAGYGFRGFLIGQTFMQEDNPERAARKFIDELSRLKLSES